MARILRHCRLMHSWNGMITMKSLWASFYKKTTASYKKTWTQSKKKCLKKASKSICLSVKTPSKFWERRWSSSGRNRLLWKNSFTQMTMRTTRSIWFNYLNKWLRIPNIAKLWNKIWSWSTLWHVRMR